MVERRDGARFLLESPKRSVSPATSAGNTLTATSRPSLVSARLVDRAHAAGPDEGVEAIGAELLAYSEPAADRRRGSEAGRGVSRAVHAIRPAADRPRS